jgi:quinol monooxygenase YgiN
MQAPEMRIAPDGTAGPAFMIVTYDVRPGAEEAFEAAVRRVGRARRRTGAVRWSLYRDADRPQRFVETFVVASWDEHMRQHERRTAFDARLQQDLRDFLVVGVDPKSITSSPQAHPRNAHGRDRTPIQDRSAGHRVVRHPQTNDHRTSYDLSAPVGRAHWTTPGELRTRVGRQ